MYTIPFWGVSTGLLLHYSETQNNAQANPVLKSPANTVHPAPKLNCQNFIVPVRGVGKQVRRRWRQEITSGRAAGGRNPDSKKEGFHKKVKFRRRFITDGAIGRGMLQQQQRERVSPFLPAISSHQTIQP